MSASGPQRPIGPPQETPPNPHAYPAHPQQPQPVQPQPVQPQPVQPQAYPVQPQAYPVQPQAVPPNAGYPPQAPSHHPQPPTAAGYPPQPAYPGQPHPVQQPTPPQPVAPAPQAVPLSAQPSPTPSAASPIPLSAQPASPVSAQPANAQQPVPVPANRPLPANSANRPQPVPARPVSVRDPAATAPSSGDDDDDDEPPTTDAAIKAAPPWLVSLVVHMVMLIIAALIVLTRPSREQVEIDVVFAEKLGEQLEDDVLQMAQLEPLDVTEPVLSKDLNPVDDPLAAPPEIDISMDATISTSDIAAPSIGMALSGREKGMKSALLAAYGGTALTEASVLKGLEWLKKNQQADGSWSLVGPYASGGGLENRAAATAMALLAFQGAGNTHKVGRFKTQVARGWTALLKMQNKDGDFFSQGANHHRLYTQAQATIAICELYGMSRDPKFKKPAQLALDFCLDSQSPQGGWRYTPRQDSDTSVTGWFVMALQSGMMAGLEVPSPNLDNISKFLDSVAVNGGSQYTYRPGGGATPAMSAEGLLCRQYLGWKHADPRLQQGVNLVNAEPIRWEDMNVYYWYYATQATHHMDGEHWNKWNAVMRQTVPAHQVANGAEQGSWDPTNDRWGSHGGRLFTTCLCIYMLEVYYRHLPIYQHRLQ